MKKIWAVLACCISIAVQAQKKPLDHSVYDAWQSIGERAITHDGKYVAYLISPQEGDGVLVVQSVSGSYKLEIPRGYNLSFTEDSRYLICKIKPAYKDTREARIRKRRPDDMPKDSLAWVELGSNKVIKTPRVKNYKLPDESAEWLAYLLDKPLPAQPDSATRLNNMTSLADSLMRAADSIRNKVSDAKTKGMAALRPARGAAFRTPEEPVEEGTELVLRHLTDGKETRFPLVSEYFFSKSGNTLVIESTRKNSDAGSKATVWVVETATGNRKTVLAGFHDAKNYKLDEAGQQLAFVAERDSSAKALQKFYKLYYYKIGMDSAAMIADRTTNGMPKKWAVSEFSNISFSKSGQRLFAGTSPVLPPKDTSLPDFERVSVDIWHYNDDYIQPVQLKTLDNELRRNYPAFVNTNGAQLVQLADQRFRNLLLTQEGDGAVFYAVSDEGKRIASQWQGFTLNDLYAVNAQTGSKELITKDFKGNLLQPSYSGKYLLYYDERRAAYFVYNSISKKIVPVAKDISVSLSDEENDVPDDPNAYGAVRWMENDKAVLIYDRYDIWQVDPEGKEKSVRITNGRPMKTSYRYINTDPDERFIKAGQTLLLRVFDEKDKSAGLATLNTANGNELKLLFKEPVSVGFQVLKAKQADVLSFTKESFERSTDVYVQPVGGASMRLSATNPQQEQYNWGTAEIFTWKAYTGKMTEGVLYKPEDFDPKKKYPMIVYFYERYNNTLHNYMAPTPTPSRLNIPFFVSRGYVVFVPDIWYKTGYPGKSAYDYILSGTRAVVKQGFVDSTKIGLQGQSWGGYQIVYLITKTNLYAAAWAGAPVANMTSAYGGIRWGSGLMRQFQYEKTQSRIGATLWEKPNLYLENSALFSLPKVTTPLVIMANDADDAVPWYQGIEMFGGMRRLGKKVWMLTYNGEAHNLVERKNRKDIQIREQQFFDYLLKGEKPAQWITDGLPAIMKGRTMALGYGE
jgi:dipeptidyl aminopeptidase/acylaminoacyl peptidase